MSYDLYFYKEKGKRPGEDEIENYLTNNLVAKNKEANHWFFENIDMEVYFICGNLIVSFFTEA